MVNIPFLRGAMEVGDMAIENEKKSAFVGYPNNSLGAVQVESYRIICRF
jgi:hypothetical protein